MSRNSPDKKLEKNLDQIVFIINNKKYLKEKNIKNLLKEKNSFSTVTTRKRERIWLKQAKILILETWVKYVILVIIKIGNIKINWRIFYYSFFLKKILINIEIILNRLLTLLNDFKLKCK